MNKITDIPDLARRVLGADKVGRDLTNAAAWDAVDLVLENAPALAHAAIRVEALADRLDAEAADDFDGVSGTSVSLVKYETAKAIRAALNGDPHA